MPVKARQPYYAFVKLSVGDVDFIFRAGKPQYLLSFRHEVGLNETGTFELEVFDPEFHYLEAVLWNSQLNTQSTTKVAFQYGYTWGRDSYLASPLFYGYVAKYTPTWNYNGVTLNIQGNILPIASHQSKDKAWRGINISDIFKDICKREGWQIGKVDETAPLYISDDLEATIPTLKVFQQQGMPPTAFITRVLCRYACRKQDGKYGYVFKLDDTKDPPEASFYIPGEGDKPSPKKTFTIRKDRQEEWLEFSYNVEITTASISGMFEVSTRTILPYNGEMVIDKTHIANNEDKVVKTESVLIHDEPTSQPNVTKRTNFTTPQTLEETQRCNLHELAIKCNMCFSASLTIAGDPEIDLMPGDYCQVLNYMPDGSLHYSSGVYLVQKVTNEISGGSFTTTYELQRNSAPIEATPTTKPKGVA